jgi:hypothetical protein
MGQILLGMPFFGGATDSQFLSRNSFVPPQKVIFSICPMPYLELISVSQLAGETKYLKKLNKC